MVAWLCMDQTLVLDALVLLLDVAPTLFVNACPLIRCLLSIILHRCSRGACASTQYFAHRLTPFNS